MAENTTNTPFASKKYVYELLYPDLDRICLILDEGNTWKHLGSEYLGFDLTNLNRFQRYIHQDKSPSEVMLLEWGQQNNKITTLYMILYRMKQYRAMKYLNKYVISAGPKYEKIARELELTSEGPTSLTLGQNTSVTKLPKPPLPSTTEEVKRMPCEGTAYGTAFGNVLPPTSLQSYNSCGSQNGAGISPHDATHQLKMKMQMDPHNNLNYPDSIPPFPSKTGFPSFHQPNIVEGTGSIHLSTQSSKLRRPPLPDQNRSSLGGSVSIEDNEQIGRDASCAKNWFPPSHSSQNRRPSNMAFRSRESAPSSFVPESILLVDYNDIVAATDNFAKERILGRGGFGVVYDGRYRHTRVAIKKIVKQQNPGLTSHEEAKLHQSYVELYTLMKYRHINILQLYSYSVHNDTLCLIYEYMINGSLEDRLQRKNGTLPLTWLQRLYIAHGSACGIQYLHSCQPPIIHGDIKSANILLDTNMVPKLGDFGLARPFPMTSQNTYTMVTAVHGTQPYLPSEYLKNHVLSTKVDTYSYGIVLLELATGFRAHDESRDRNKYLIDFVTDSKRNTEILRDRSAGEQFTEFCDKFIDTGCRCAADKRKDRPEMVTVFEDLEKIIKNLKSKEVPVLDEMKQEDINDNHLKDSNVEKESSSVVISIDSAAVGSMDRRDSAVDQVVASVNHSGAGGDLMLEASKQSGPEADRVDPSVDQNDNKETKPPMVNPHVLLNQLPNLTILGIKDS